MISLKKDKFNIIFVVMLMAFAALMVLNATTPAFAQCVATDGGSGVQCQTLYAGQTINAGMVCVEVVDENLVVTYTTTDGWELTEAHLWVGSVLGDMPQTKQGNPKIGNFPYITEDIFNNLYSFSVPLSELKPPGSDLGFSCPGEDVNYFVAAHAALRKPDGLGGYQTETGWADGVRFVERGMWGTYFTITLTCECGGYSEPKCDEPETAFAYGVEKATCFLDIDENGNANGDGEGAFNRWGWTNGPLSAGSYSYDIYAGAGQCDLSKGTLVGTLTVEYDGSTATITYIMDSGFTMSETQLYVGYEILARNNGEFTVAPGQFPYKHNTWDSAKSSDTYNITGLSGTDIYVVAHTSVCGVDN